MTMTTGDSITFGFGFTHDLGPRCETCKATEARCAVTAKCCGDCSHFWWLTPNGEAPLSSPAGRRRLPVEHGTERGYQQHRVRHEPACRPCKYAHSVKAVAS